MLAQEVSRLKQRVQAFEKLFMASANRTIAANPKGTGEGIPNGVAMFRPGTGGNIYEMGPSFNVSNGYGYMTHQPSMTSYL